MRSGCQRLNFIDTRGTAGSLLELSGGKLEITVGVWGTVGLVGFYDWELRRPLDGP